MNLKTQLFPCPSANAVCYILLPIEIDLRPLQGWAKEYNTCFVAVTGFDWDDDLSPWPAPNVPSTEPPFKGLAADTLQCLVAEVMPQAEKALRLSSPERTWAGVSLSGMFALWAWMQGDGEPPFRNLISMSGSFWYPGYIQWLQANVKHRDGCASFTLGTKEGGPRGPKEFADIRQQTAEAVALLNQAGIPATLRLNPGTHFAPMLPRLQLALQALQPLAAAEK